MIVNEAKITRTISAKNVLEQLRKDIILGKYEVNQKLTEKALIERFDIGRSVTRKVLQILADDGFLYSLANGVHYVSGFDEKFFSDIYGIRTLLEKKAIELVINSKEFINLAPLFEALNKLKEEADLEQKLSKNIENDKRVSLTMNIHYEMVKASGNRALIHAWRTTTHITTVIMAINLEQISLMESFEHHKLICDSLILKSDNIADVLEKHMDYSKNNFLKNLKLLGII